MYSLVYWQGSSRVAGRPCRDMGSIEVHLRPKFVYGKSWRPADFTAVFDQAARIEEICREVLR